VHESDEAERMCLRPAVDEQRVARLARHEEPRLVLGEREHGAVQLVAHRLEHLRAAGVALARAHLVESQELQVDGSALSRARGGRRLARPVLKHLEQLVV